MISYGVTSWLGFTFIMCNQKYVRASRHLETTSLMRSRPIWNPGQELGFLSGLTRKSDWRL
jgi:hypothetical protein